MAHMNAHVQKVILVMAKIARTSTNVVMVVQNVTKMQIVSMSRWTRTVTVTFVHVKTTIMTSLATEQSALQSTNVTSVVTTAMPMQIALNEMLGSAMN